jgi:predicted  nucleic acid-binding Zn-ribbon protein
MGYRGADLDLRTSRAWTATSTDLMSGFEAPGASGPQEPRAQSGRSGGSIWVDDTVLACANHAYDVAQGHHAAEVRLEHLIFALTRVEAAANALDARGVRVVPLRRDAAMVVASEIPIGHGGPGASPRRSLELEEALRLAAAHAARAGRPASVEHVLRVLIDQRGDLPGAELLLRHLPRSARDFWSSPGHTRESGYLGAGHYVDVPEPERFRAAVRADYLPAPEVHPEAAPHTVSPSAASAPSFAIDEVLVRFAQTERALSERLSMLESAVTRSPPAGASADLTAIRERLDVIEEALLAREGDQGISERLSALVRMLQEERAERTNALSELSGEVKALAAALGWDGLSGGSQEFSFAERLRNLATDLEQHRIELGASLGDRIAAIEKTLDAHSQKVADAHSAYSDEIAEVHDALMKLNTNQHTLAGSIDQWRSSEAGEIHLINTRIGAVQEDGLKRLLMLERLCSDMEALSRTARAEIPQKRPQPMTFRYWLFGTDDWLKASWMKRPRPKA